MSNLGLEFKIWSSGPKLIAGIDEVGRGPIAGPVVAAAVIFPTCTSRVELRSLEAALQGVDDSKLLSHHQRVKAYAIIRRQALDIGIGAVSPQEIDRVGISAAFKSAMAQAVLRLNRLPEQLFIDGNQPLRPADFQRAFNSRRCRLKPPKDQIPALTIIKGDSISLSISAASIIAKVTCDRIMIRLASQFPLFGFERHKGYGTSEHVKMLEELVPTPHHRHSFAPLSQSFIHFDDDVPTK